MNVNEAKKALETIYSNFINEIDKQKQYYDEKKSNLNKNINQYKNRIEELNKQKEKIENEQENYIGQNKDRGRLLPEKDHEKDVIENKIKFYEKIKSDLEKKKNEKEKELNKKISDCIERKDRYDKEKQIIKQAILNKKYMELKIDDIVEIRDLINLKKDNEYIVNHI